jgi:hypothetical protein
MSQFWKLVSLPVLVASIVSCVSSRTASYQGRLDVEVRPENAEASHRRLQGSFAVRTEDGRTVERLVVVNPYDTLSVSLPEGSYRLEWQPVQAFQSEQEAAARAGALPAVGSALSVVADRVTTVHARVVVTRDDDPELAALAGDLPSVDILIARH